MISRDRHDHIVCCWNGCGRSASIYTVRTTNPDLPQGGNNQCMPLVETGVVNSYCDEHKRLAEENGFKVVPFMRGDGPRYGIKNRGLTA